jgi:hypothetical protein
LWTIAPYLVEKADTPEAFLFSPADTMRDRAVELRKNRKTLNKKGEVQPSHKNRRKENPKRTPGEQYSPEPADNPFMNSVPTTDQAEPQHVPASAADEEYKNLLKPISVRQWLGALLLVFVLVGVGRATPVTVIVLLAIAALILNRIPGYKKIATLIGVLLCVFVLIVAGIEGISKLGGGGSRVAPIDSNVLVKAQLKLAVTANGEFGDALIRGHERDMNAAILEFCDHISGCSPEFQAAHKNFGEQWLPP